VFSDNFVNFAPEIDKINIKMGILSKLFGSKKSEEENKTGGMEDYMTLIRVYFQAAIAAQVGITNLAALPDLRVFKNHSQKCLR